MTPLEKAKQPKHCNDITIIDDVMYCNKSGKIILPMFTKNEENKECDIKKCRTLTERSRYARCIREDSIEIKRRSRIVGRGTARSKPI